MSKVCRAALVVAAIAAIAAVAAAASPGHAENSVLHATVTRAYGTIEVWKDPSDGELAFHLDGSDRVAILRGKAYSIIEEGHLTQVQTYRAAGHAWRPIAFQYGLTQEATGQALTGAESVARPALMDVPTPDWSTTEYSYVIDYDTDVGALRRAVRFAVPSPGSRLAGLRLAQVQLIRFLGPGRGLDSGRLAVITYSSDPARIGLGGDREIQLTAASPTRGFGASYRTDFINGSDKLSGPGYDARVADNADVILRYHGAYVLISLRLNLSRAQWRKIVAQIARSPR